MFSFSFNNSSNSIPFTIVIEKEIPASVQLLPAKKYTGSPIGTSYDIRIFAISNDDIIDEKIKRRSTVRLGVRFVHKIYKESELYKSDFFDLSRQSSLPRSERLRMKLLSPKARKLIKQTSVMIRKSNISQKVNQECETENVKLKNLSIENAKVRKTKKKFIGISSRVY